MADEEPKIIIDSDWKKEAQEEKERLAQEEMQAHDGGAGGPLPAAQFLEIVNMISMQAAIAIGGFQTPDGKIIPPSIDAAKHHIDLLEILLKKTENNLDDQESAALSGTLHELRLAYIQSATGAVDHPASGDTAG